MRKKDIIVWVLVVIMVLSMAGCSITPIATLETTSAEKNESNKLEFRPKGTYVKAEFGEEFLVYKFDAPNETIVVYKTIDGIYLIGEYGKKSGISYGSIFRPEGEFIGLSNKYLLFENEDEKTAVALEKKKNVEIGESFYKLCPFDDLSDEEKNAFVYPIECEKVER